MLAAATMPDVLFQKFSFVFTGMVLAEYGESILGKT